ncbi:hypothetical protein HDE_04082 [Halotydeus destructor]|nr:hypothetical protein HDE_04082 [Halotydeus destructor]
MSDQESNLTMDDGSNEQDLDEGQSALDSFFTQIVSHFPSVPMAMMVVKTLEYFEFMRSGPSDDDQREKMTKLMMHFSKVNAAICAVEGMTGLPFPHDKYNEQFLPKTE